MRAVVQRVAAAAVTVGGEVVGSIGKGLVVFLAVGCDDREADLEWMVDKVVHLRCFEDEQGKMNRSLLETRGEVLCISQFTLYGDCRRGRRPSFEGAAPPDLAKELYRKFVDRMREKGVKIEAGRFGARMRVSCENDGPVTLILDSRD